MSRGWLYILECSDGTYYAGSTVDLERRLFEHEHGLGANYTRKRLPVRLVFCQEFPSIADAFTREIQVKDWSQAKKRALIEGSVGEK